MGKWLALTAICLITVMLGIDATALNIAIPVIANDFYASLTSMQWVINAFFLLAAMVQILGGHLGDSYGHKKIFLITVILFIISSAGAGFSVSEGMLITFRALQGASIGISTPLTIALLLDVFPKDKQSYARSFVVATMGIALAVGAPIGGFFVHTIGWRWIFYINIPIGIICYILAQIYCVSKKPEEKKKIDLKGVSLLIIALFGITFAFNQVQNWGFLSLYFCIFFLGGLLFLYFLYRNEKKQKDPIVDFSLFKKRNFLINNVLRLILQIVFLSILFFLPLYLQNAAGLSAIASGFTMLALTLVMTLVSPFVGKWVDREGDKKANIFFMSLLIIASIFFFFLKGEPNFYLLCIGLVIFGVGIATDYISTVTGALEGIPEKKIGAATGLFFTIAWLGCAIGVAFSGTLIAYEGTSSLFTKLHEQKISLDSSQLQVAMRAAKGIFPVSSLKEKIPSSILSQVEKISSSSFAEAIHANALMFVILCFVGLILAFFLKKHVLHKNL